MPCAKAGRSKVRKSPLEDSVGDLRGLALQQAATDLVRCADLDSRPGSATGADPVATDRLAVGAVVQHGEHFPLA